MITNAKENALYTLVEGFVKCWQLYNSCELNSPPWLGHNILIWVSASLSMSALNIWHAMEAFDFKPK